MSTYVLTQDKDTKDWHVLSLEEYKQEKEFFHKPLEVVTDEEEVQAIRFMANHMNLSPGSTKFWRYNAAKKVDKGGRLAYAKLLMEMEEEEDG